MLKRSSINNRDIIVPDPDTVESIIMIYREYIGINDIVDPKNLFVWLHRVMYNNVKVIETENA